MAILFDELAGIDKVDILFFISFILLEISFNISILLSVEELIYLTL